jgi:hypothetical protein
MQQYRQLTRHGHARLPQTFLDQFTSVKTLQLRISACGHSSITVTMRYTHTNLDAKRNATLKLEGFSGNLVTPCAKLQQSKPKVSPITPLKAVASYT